MSAELPPLTIFVSSPGDVGEERQLVKRVIERLAAEVAHRARVQPIFWEHEPLVATADFQSQITRPSQADIVICVLWSRLGTRLSAHLQRADGSAYDSGTEFEFEDALAGRKQRGDKPDLLVYRKTVEPRIGLKDTAMALESIRQKAALDAFMERWFMDRAQVSFIAAFHPFEHSAQLEDLVEAHLRKLFVRHLPPVAEGALAQQSAAARWVAGSPFRGLEVFDYQHAAIYFGRTLAVGEVLAALRKQAAGGRAFVLVLGMSGCGKSSMVRAGIIPLLIQPGVVEGAALWRRAIMRPSDSLGDSFDALAAALLQPDALPELASAGTGAAELAELLRDSPRAAAPLLEAALAGIEGDAGEDACSSGARLALVVDQLEELFTMLHVSQQERADFSEVIAALARSGRIYVIATLRSDFYHRCAELPELVALKENGGQYDLRPPSASEISQMVRRPALAAGLRFEEHAETGQALDDVLRDAGAAQPESLPLLQFALEELYRERRRDGTLTFGAYREMGGVEGALARRAEEVFSALPEDARAVLPQVFRSLVTVGSGAEGEVAARRTAPLQELSATPALREFVQAFVKARLLVADRTLQGGSEVAVLRVAHEALLSHWPRLARWIESDKDLLRVLARVQESAARWDARERRVDYLLQQGKPLQEAQALLAAGFEVSSREAAFIRASVARAGRSRSLQRAAVALLALLALAAAAGGLLARQQREEARVQSRRAEESRYAAEMRLIQQSASEGNLGAVRDGLARFVPAAGAVDLRGFEWRYLLKLLEGESLATFGGHQGEVRDVAFSPDGALLASASADRSVRIHDVSQRREIARLELEGFEGLDAEFSPDGTQLAISTGNWSNSSEPGRVFLYAVPSFELREQRTGQQGAVNAISYSPDGRWLASGGDDNRALLHDLSAPNSAPRVFPGHAIGVNAVAFAARGELLAVGSGDGFLQLWDVETSRLVVDRLVHVSGILSLAASADGAQLAVGTRDGPVLLFDLASARVAETLTTEQGVIHALAYSADGQTLATGGSGGTVKLWSLQPEPRQRVRLLGHFDAVFAAAFSPDGRYLATGSTDRTVKLWSAQALPSQSAQGFGGRISGVAFSPDGRSVALAVGSRPDLETETVRQGSAVVVDLESGARRSFGDQASDLLSVAFSPDGALLATAGTDATAALWDVASGERRALLRGHAEPIDCVAFSPDGRTLATASHDHEIRIWDVPSGAPRATLKEHAGRVRTLAFSPDGRWLASGGSDRALRIWDVQRWQVLATLGGYGGAINSVAFGPGSTLLATGSSDAVVRLWDLSAGPAALAPGREIALRGRNSAVQAVAFSVDGRTLAAASLDSRVSFWNVGTLLEVGVFTPHRGGVLAAAFAPDGNTLATGSNDETLGIFRAAAFGTPGVLLHERPAGWSSP